MRQYVVSHIVKDDLKNVCGFCGLTGCNIEICFDSRRGKTASETPKWTCEFYQKCSQPVYQQASPLPTL